MFPTQAASPPPQGKAPPLDASTAAKLQKIDDELASLFKETENLRLEIKTLKAHDDFASPPLHKKKSEERLRLGKDG